MKSFRDLLNEPLPSAMYEGCCKKEDGEFCDDIDSEFDNNLDDPNPCAPALPDDGDEGDGFEPSAPVPDVSDDEVEPLTPEGEQRVDDTISAVATPLLIKTDLTEEEVDEFVESVDSDIAVSEGLLTEKTIIKFDKNAKKAQLFEVAVAACAREHKDPLFRKLETVYKMERVIKAKLRKKYYSEAQRKVKEYLKRASKSKSNIITRIARKITGKK